MSQSVSRLKELLFDREAQALRDLSQRLDALALDQHLSTAELKDELTAIVGRVGSNEQLTVSVAEIIDEALRRAEVNKHSELSLSIAPLVVTTIKAELKNSQDEMVEALYPITGRLVKSYVASAIKDLADDMNRRLEQNPLMLRLQSLTTGKSVGELALASTQDFRVLELFLIRRGSGELVAHWPQEAGGREHLMSGVLAAVNAFANEAFAADEATLREIDLGEETVYLRGSQLYLLAAKCQGTAPKYIEQTLDDAFLATIEKKLDFDSGSDSPEIDNRKLIADLGTDVQTRVEERKRLARKSSGRPLKVMATLVLLPLLGWMTWRLYEDFANTRTREAAAGVVSADADMQGYPARLEATRAGTTLRISGLAPSQDAKERLLSGISRVLPKVTLTDELAVVPGSDIEIPDTKPQFDEVRRAVRDLQAETERSTIARLATRASLRLLQARADLQSAATSFGNENALKRDKAATASAAISALANEIGTLAAQLDDDASRSTDAGMLGSQIDSFAKRLAELNLTVAELTGAARDATAVEASGNAAIAAETLVAGAERYAALASVAAAASSLKPVQITMPVPVPVEKPAPPPDPRDVLETFAARNAIFFANNADYRDEARTGQTLDALVPLIKAANVLVRIVGYTDVAGTAPGNASLSQVRADKVRADLVARGAPEALVVAVGRRDSNDLSPAQGADSPNRRVTFEVGYDGEAGQ
jgi:outer membrane protein OmpA-like peptidoglycan-associated protein